MVPSEYSATGESFPPTHWLRLKRQFRLCPLAGYYMRPRVATLPVPSSAVILVFLAKSPIFDLESRSGRRQFCGVFRRKQGQNCIFSDLPRKINDPRTNGTTALWQL